MVRVEGTYTTVRTQDYVNFLLHLGLDKAKAEKFLGTHWTLKIWRDGAAWGGHFVCQEFPKFSSVYSRVDGLQKTVNVPICVGKATTVFKQTSELEFLTTIDSEKFGKVTLAESYSADGAKHTLTGKGKSITETWDRKVQFEGSYRFEKGENVEAFNNATGFPEFNAVYKDYKLYFVNKNGRTHMAEFFGRLGKVYNSFVLNEETQYRMPGENNKSDGSHRLVVSTTGSNKRLMVIKGPKGNIQEWELIFSDSGLITHAWDKASNAKCTYYLKRFVEASGPWKKLSITGFEDFAKALGIPASRAQDMIADKSGIFEILDLGNGVFRHKITNSKYSTEYSFKLNEEFTYTHPLLREDVKAVVTQHDNVMTMTVNTSKGIFKSKMTFNDTFLITATCSEALGQGYKVVMMRSCCM